LQIRRTLRYGHVRQITGAWGNCRAALVVSDQTAPRTKDDSVYRQLTPDAPTTAAVTLPISLVLGLLLTVSVWDLFGLVGVLLGWMLMVIPLFSYLLGLPVAFLLARLESSMRRPVSPTGSAMALPVGMDRRSV
jgi:hypothetical protein